jgi:hypothetical protein
MAEKEGRIKNRIRYWLRDEDAYRSVETEGSWKL